MTKTAAPLAPRTVAPTALPLPFATDVPEPGICALPGFADLDGSNDRIVILGDTQVTPVWQFWKERNGALTKAILAELAARFPAAIINLGDLVVTGASRGHWRVFDDLHAPVRAARIPYFAVRGNHDYRGPRDRALAHRDARLPHLQGRPWHAFRFRYAGIALLDSNFRTLGRGRANAQARWLERTLAEMEASPDIQVVICCTHHPPYSDSLTPWPHKEVQRRFLRPFQMLRKPGLFFSGHIHSYERFRFSDKHFIVSGGGGGHRSRVRTGHDLRMPGNAYLGPPVRPLHFCQLDLRPDGLKLRAECVEGPGPYHFVTIDELDLPIRERARGRSRRIEEATAQASGL